MERLIGFGPPADVIRLVLQYLDAEVLSCGKYSLKLFMARVSIRFYYCRPVNSIWIFKHEIFLNNNELKQLY